MFGEAELEPGRQLGRYVLEKTLTSGGMGVVYVAADPRHERKVAIKLIRHDRLAEPGIAERFRRESSNQAGISHPNILPLLDSGRTGDVSFFVTPFVEAGDLERLRSRRSLSLAELAHVVRQVADALAMAHRAGIIHRDVKPRNILVADDVGLGIYLADFGLSLRMADPRLTPSGACHGTLAYMAPEQFTGQAITPATDVYALAVTTHEMATGRLRCGSGCATGSAATARLCEVVQKGTADDPARRHASTSDFAAAVTAAVEDRRMGEDLLLRPHIDVSGPWSDTGQSLDIPAASWPPQTTIGPPTPASTGPPPSDWLTSGPTPTDVTRSSPLTSSGKRTRGERPTTAERPTRPGRHSGRSIVLLVLAGVLLTAGGTVAVALSKIAWDTEGHDASQLHIPPTVPAAPSSGPATIPQTPTATAAPQPSQPGTPPPTAVPVSTPTPTQPVSAPGTSTVAQQPASPGVPSSPTPGTTTLPATGHRPPASEESAQTP